MIFVCLMGITGSGKSTLESKLEGMGFKRSVSYTTREPQVRNGVQEVDGREYKFVTTEKFMNLVENKIIIEYEKYGNNYYGTPEPFGSTRYVSVVCLNGYKALRNKYGKQVIGVYLKIDKDLAIERATGRDKTDEQVMKRLESDLKIADEIEKSADIVVDASMSTIDILADIMKEIKKRKGEFSANL